MDRLIGTMLDNRYELLEIVGTGGMAVVYRAKCHRLNRFVAVKILKPEAAQDPELRQRFRDESQAVAMLSHPNIVAVYDVSKTDNLEYIVMELIDGITLKQYTRQKGGVLPWKEAMHFITQVIRGLRHAHSRGIIHRDIKPQNIMVLRDGSCKVADFGIATLGNAPETTDQEALGSVHYTAPEQAKGARVDARTDLYSAGVVLYELLTGHVPYDGDTPVAVARARNAGEPEPPSNMNSNIPFGLDQITLKAMATKPSGRYDSARAMLVDLDTLRKNPQYVFPYTIGKGPAAKTPTEDEEATKFSPTVTDAILNSPPRIRPERRRKAKAYTEAEQESGYLQGNRRKRKKRKNYIPLAILAVLLIILLFGACAMHSASSGAGVTIPDLVGMQYDTAVSRYGDNYNIIIGSYLEDDSLEQGAIISQDPEAGESSEATKPTITVVVCVHATSITMPDIVGYNEADALSALLGAGISSENIIKGTSVYSDTVEEGFVVTTSPAAGSPMTSDTTVTYYLSKGVDPDSVSDEDEETVTVPNFVGSSRTQTLVQLQELGLSGTFTEVSDSSDAGTVLTQSVASGSQLTVGSTITFTVSTGPEETTSDTDADTETQDDQEDTEEEEDTTDDSEEDSTESTTATVSVSKSYTVSLPSDSEEVTVVVQVDGSTMYSRSGVDTSQGSITVTISGSGTQTVTVYIDGTLTSSESVTFS